MVLFSLQVVHQWPGLPKGVKFDPSDQELLWHLLAKHGKSGIKPHPFIDEFIPTVEEVDGICYTHPQKLPGICNILSEGLWEFSGIRIGVLEMSKKMTFFISDKIKCKSLHHTATAKFLSLLRFWLWRSLLLITLYNLHLV